MQDFYRRQDRTLAVVLCVKVPHRLAAARSLTTDFRKDLPEDCLNSTSRDACLVSDPSTKIPKDLEESRRILERSINSSGSSSIRYVRNGVGFSFGILLGFGWDKDGIIWLVFWILQNPIRGVKVSWETPSPISHRWRVSVVLIVCPTPNY